MLKGVQFMNQVYIHNQIFPFSSDLSMDLFKNWGNIPIVVNYNELESSSIINKKLIKVLSVSFTTFILW